MIKRDDLISRKAVLELLQGSDTTGYKPSALREKVAAIPVEDAVPVVRCEECKYRMHHPESYKTLLCTNKHWAAEFLPVVNSDRFCAYGDREDGVTDGN